MGDQVEAGVGVLVPLVDGPEALVVDGAHGQEAEPGHDGVRQHEVPEAPEEGRHGPHERQGGVAADRVAEVAARLNLPGERVSWGRGHGGPARRGRALTNPKGFENTTSPTMSSAV